MNNLAKKHIELYSSIQKFSSGVTKNSHLYSNFNDPKQNEAFISLVKNQRVFNALNSIHIKYNQLHDSHNPIHDLTIEQYNKTLPAFDSHLLPYTINSSISGYNHEISNHIHSINPPPEVDDYTPTINLTNPILRPLKP